MGCEASKQRDINAELMKTLPANTGFVKPLVICGSDGSGKTILIEYLKTHYHEKMVKAVSCTTRPKREDEVDGLHHIFID